MALIIRNAFFSSISLCLRLLANTALFVILARALGTAEFGRFAFAISLTTIFLVIIDYGYNLLIVKEIATAPQETLHLVDEALKGKLLLTLGSTVLLLCFFRLFPYPWETEAIVYLLWLAAIFYSFGFFFNNVFRGLNQFQVETVATLLLNILLLVLTVVLILSGFKAVAIALAYLFSRICYFALSLYFLQKKVGRPKIRVNLIRGWHTIKSSFPFGIHAILGTLYFQVDTVFLSLFKGNTEVGHYQAAMRIVLATMILSEIFSSAYYPVIAHKIKQDLPGFKRDALTLTKYCLLLGGALGIFFLLYAEIIIKLAYGPGYHQSILLLQLLAAVIFLRYLGTSYAMFLTVADNQKIRAYGVAASLVVNVTLNLLLIPRYGALGAAWASIGTHIFLGAIYITFSTMVTKTFFWDGNCTRGSAILAICGLLAFYLKDFSMLSSLLVFGLALPLLLLFFSSDKKEKQMFLSWARKLSFMEAKFI